MDLPPPVQDPGAGPGPERAAGPERPPERGIRTTPEGAALAGDAAMGSARTGELEWRLSQLEAGLRHIDRRLDRLEDSIGKTVAQETQAVARDLRRTVSELGRRLVLELPQVLARHRDEIVAELRPPQPPPEMGPDPGPPPEPDDLDVEAVASPAAVPEPAAAPAGPAKRRRRAHGRRRRDS